MLPPQVLPPNRLVEVELSNDDIDPSSHRLTFTMSHPTVGLTEPAGHG
jgi:hypothetical protein